MSNLMIANVLLGLAVVTLAVMVQSDQDLMAFYAFLATVMAAHMRYTELQKRHRH